MMLIWPYIRKLKEASGVLPIEPWNQESAEFRNLELSGICTIRCIRYNNSSGLGICLFQNQESAHADSVYVFFNQEMTQRLR